MSGEDESTGERPVDDKASGAYALGALDENETRAFERLLRESEDLRAEVAGFTDTAALLAAAVGPVAPPAALRANVLDLIARTPQNEAPAEVVEAPVSHPTPVTNQTAEAESGRSNVVGIGAARSRREKLRRGFVGGLVAAAAAVALFVGGVTVGNSLDSGSDSADQFAAISAAADLERVNVQLPDGGTVALFASADLELSAVVMHDVKPLSDGEIYQAWYVRDGQPVSAGLMPKVDDGYQILESGYQPNDVVALTVEPEGGSKLPTTDPVVFVDSATATASAVFAAALAAP